MPIIFSVMYACIAGIFKSAVVLMQQDQLNNTNSAFILINRLISRGFQSGSIGPGGQGGLSGPGRLGVPDGQVRVVRGSGWSGWSEGQVVRWSGGEVVRW